MMNFTTLKIKNYTALLFAFFLPLKFSISNFFLIVFLVLSLFQIVLNKQYKFNYKPIKFSTISIVLPFIIGLLYTVNIKSGFHNLGQSISFILLPLFFGLGNLKDLKSTLSFLKKGLIIGVSLTLIILLTNTIYNFFSTDYKTVLDILNYNSTRANFTKLLKIHPTYLGVYVAFSIVLVINYYRNKKSNLILVSGTLLLLFIGVVFINQRIIFLLFFLIIFTTLFFILKNLIQKKAYQTFAITTIAVILLSTISFTQIKKTYIYYRFTKELAWEFSNEKNSFYTEKKEAISDPRLIRWKSIIKLIKEKPVFGYGVGSEKEVLGKMFLEKNMKNSYKFKYDTHNQYLSILVETGIFGLLFFLFFLTSNFYFSFKSKNIEYFSLFLIATIVGLVENLLTRNAGITFFAFFSSLYLFIHLNKIKE